jgi:hypothetical protein
MSAQGSDIRGLGANAGNGILYTDGIALSPGSNNFNVIDSAGALLAVNNLLAVDVTVTLAELNAGKVIIPAIPGRTIKVWQYFIQSTGAFAAATDVRLQDSAVSPVVITTALIAALTNGAKISSEVVVANVTDGAGFTGSLTLGKGVSIAKTGSAATTGTSLRVKIYFSVS